MQLAAHQVPQARIQIAQRLVKQHQLGPRHQPARQRHALLLATTQLRRIAVEEAFTVNQLDRFFDPVFGQALFQAAHPERVFHILAHRHVRPKRIGLEHHSNAALVRRKVNAMRCIEHRIAAECDPTGVGHLKPRQTTQRRGLAASTRAQQDQELALFNLKTQVVDRSRGGIAAVFFRQSFNGYMRHLTLVALVGECSRTAVTGSHALRCA